MARLRQMAQDMENGTGDPVHVREEGFGQQRDSHDTRVRRAGACGAPFCPDVRDVHRMLRRASPARGRGVSIHGGE
ncbi:hypothetical protein CHE218_10350 [Microbacterium sp. che218]